MELRIATAAVIALTLVGCAGLTTPATEVSDTTSSPVLPSAAASSAATSSVAPTPAAAPAKGDKPSKDFLIGKWGTDGDCTLAIDLRSDGTSDGPFGNWTYTDGVIGFADEPDFKVNVTVIDDNTMQSINADGKTAKMTRCP